MSCLSSYFAESVDEGMISGNWVEGELAIAGIADGRLGLAAGDPLASFSRLLQTLTNMDGIASMLDAQPWLWHP